MRIETYERIFMVLAGLMLALGIVGIAIGALVAGVHVPSPAGRVDPRALSTTPPFDQPGLRDLGGGKYEAVLVARAWQFQPNEIEVPVGSTVTFTLASSDVIHGFELTGTNANVMVIPGQISQVTARFDQPGEYLWVCHEYCGFGHHQMYGKVVVR
ncbi:cytochrome c oxidase subunit II [Thermomicrobium sp. 4228-Ro]|uniref:cytochrome c oxidase subunit II n=1 Tax=Thermomicrobium sp. 4228-Ro TaxID=2993937 RepID=UPI00224996D9|nr:cytochrome c oxidase subunit II [Thermomicrobium sp. 4228-Ro]MCX2726308.1 cytochrome c oxidase subunit II [Thermomicrobium sp. 4228-Ro]